MPEAPRPGLHKFESVALPVPGYLSTCITTKFSQEQLIFIDTAMGEISHMWPTHGAAIANTKFNISFMRINYPGGLESI